MNEKAGSHQSKQQEEKFDVRAGRCLYAGAQPDIFQGRGGFLKLGHFNKYFVKYSRTKGPAGEISDFFS